MTTRRRMRAFSPQQLDAKVRAILLFTDPPPPAAVPSPPRRPRSASPWSAEELDDRSFIICQRWAKLSGTDVKLSDARRVARLRLPLRPCSASCKPSMIALAVWVAAGPTSGRLKDGWSELRSPSPPANRCSSPMTRHPLKAPSGARWDRLNGIDNARNQQHRCALRDKRPPTATF